VGGRVTIFVEQRASVQAEEWKGPNIWAFYAASVNWFADFLFKSAGAKRLSRLYNVIRDDSAGARNFKT
jgi:hypothetical protein